MCTHPIAKEALTLHLARSEGHERYFGCNLMYRKVLVSSHQHLMAEAPERRLIFGNNCLQLFFERFSHGFGPIVQKYSGHGLHGQSYQDVLPSAAVLDRIDGTASC